MKYMIVTAALLMSTLPTLAQTATTTPDGRSAADSNSMRTSPSRASNASGVGSTQNGENKQTMTGGQAGGSAERGR